MSSSALRTVIVDSDPEARAAIRHALATVSSLALVGEYLARIQRDVESRPLYTIDTEIGG